MNLVPLPPLPTVAVASHWFRAVRPIHVPLALTTAHTVWIPGRFNSGRPGSPGFPILYLAEDSVTPLFEVGALVGSPFPGGVVMPVPGALWSVVQVRVALTSVVDLTDPAVLVTLGTSVQELTGDWRGYAYRLPHPFTVPFSTAIPTQQLGHALANTGTIEGAMTFSARFPTRRNLILFRNNIRPVSSVVATHPATGLPIVMP